MKVASSARRGISAVLTLVLCCALSVIMVPAQSFAAEGAGTTTVGVSVQYGQTAARSMLEMINDFRTGSDAWEWNATDTEKVYHTGLSPLAYDYELEEAAKYRAAEIALSFSHTMLDGTSNVWDEKVTSWTSVGENIAAGQTTAQSAFTTWQETDENYAGQGHRRNMLSSDFSAVGIGHVVCNGYHYWVQVFRAPTSNAAQTPADDAQRTVNLDIADSNISTSSATASPSSFALNEGQSVGLPAITASVLVNRAWPSTPSTVTLVEAPVWQSGDTAVADISNGKVTAVAAGTTTLTTTVHVGRDITVSVPVTVTAAETSGGTGSNTGDGATGDGSSTGGTTGGTGSNTGGTTGGDGATGGGTAGEGGATGEGATGDGGNAGTGGGTSGDNDNAGEGTTGDNDPAGTGEGGTGEGDNPTSGDDPTGDNGDASTGDDHDGTGDNSDGATAGGDQHGDADNVTAKPTEIGVPTATNYTYDGVLHHAAFSGFGYELSGTMSATAAGTYTVVATPLEGYAWRGGSTASKTLTWTIAKAKPAITATAKPKTVKAKAAKKKAQSFKMKAWAESGANLTYTVTKANKNISFKNGKATLKKGAKKGTYSVKVKVHAPATDNYTSASKTFTLTFKVVKK